MFTYCLGRNEPERDKKKQSRCLVDEDSIASEHISRFVYEYNRTGGAREPFFTTNNIALAADLFRVVGGFATSIPSATAEDK